MNEENRKEFQEELVNLSQRVNNIEDDLEQIKSSRAEKRRVDEVRTQIDKILSDIEDIFSTLQQVQSTLSDLEGIQNQVDSLETDIFQQKNLLETQIKDANERISDLRKQVNYDVDTEGEVNIPDDASEIEYISVLPKTLRKEIIDSKPLFRASIIYNNFERWSKYTPSGKVLKSGEIYRCYPDELEYEQIYRAMRSFGQNTNSDYSFIDTDSTGKALVKHSH